MLGRSVFRFFGRTSRSCGTREGRSSPAGQQRRGGNRTIPSVFGRTFFPVELIHLEPHETVGEDGTTVG